MTAVAGSGIRIMSDSLMPFQPAIDEPSNILPSLKNPSSTSRVGMVTWCSLPIVSVKRRSANFASFSLINFRTSAGVMCVLAGLTIWPGLRPGFCRQLQLMCHCDAYTDQALAAAAASLCIIMDQTAKIRAPDWCIAVLPCGTPDASARNRLPLSELGAWQPLRHIRVASLYSRPLPRREHPMAHAQPKPPRTFQDLIFALQKYWSEQGCVILQPYDMEMGAGTFHTATFLRAVGPEPWSAAYVQPSRRPTDGRYGDNPFRLQHYYQFQVCIKPSPDSFQELYLDSLRYLGFDPLTHDIRFVEDNWESPT